MANPALGPGKVLIFVYGIFAIAATARATFQLLTKFNDAPVAYLLSALAALVYVLATISLLRSGPFWFRIAKWTLLFELGGVLLIGSLSILQPGLFAHPSVWSQFGQGYLFIPLILPLLGLYWLRRRGEL